MTDTTLLSAVAAAAAGTETAVKPAALTATSLKSDHPAVFAEVFAAGAEHESQRIAGIEAAALPGHDKVIAAHKADRGKTPADAALAVLNAERGLRAVQAQSLDADEQKLKGLRSEATPSGDPPKKPAMDPQATAAAARAYIGEQAKLGITVSPAQAVAHIEQKGF